MIKTILHWLNYALGALVAILGLYYLLLVGMGAPEPVEMPPFDIGQQTDELPPNSFIQEEEAYQAIDAPFLTVDIPPPTLQLPDLRPHLSYFGTNDRPDIASDIRLLNFGLKGSDELALIAPGEPLFLVYDSSKKPGRYAFSPDNAPTSLWIEADKEEDKAKVSVKMTDPKEELVTEPKKRALLTLKAKDFSRFGGKGKWEIGKWRVDGTLLARQRARWYGQDLFLNAHGGEEFAEVRSKERIEFGEKDQKYVVYVGLGDCLVWNGERWKAVIPGDASRDFPMMCLQKVEERLLRWELWDVGGKGRVALNLVRSKEAWAPKTYTRDFKYISARTLSQYNFDVKKERVVLRPYDWLLRTEEGWKPLTTVEEIDAYVDRQTEGVLFVFEGPTQKEERQVLAGTFYSKTRTNVHPIEFVLDTVSPILRRSDEETPQSPGSDEEGESSSSDQEPAGEKEAEPLDTEGASGTPPTATVWPGALERRMWEKTRVPTDPQGIHQQPGRLREDLRSALEQIHPKSDDDAF